MLVLSAAGWIYRDDMMFPVDEPIAVTWVFPAISLAALFVNWFAPLVTPSK